MLLVSLLLPSSPAIAFDEGPQPNFTPGKEQKQEKQLRSDCNPYCYDGDEYIKATSLESLDPRVPLSTANSMPFMRDIYDTFPVVYTDNFNRFTQQRRGEFSRTEEVARAINVMGDRSPSYVNVYDDQVGWSEYSPIKKGDIIMSLYQLYGVDYYTTPVIYQKPYSSPEIHCLPAKDTIFYTLLPSADENTRIHNFNAITSVYLNNNFTEAYLCRAVEDSVIDKTHLTTQAIESIENLYRSGNYTNWISGPASVDALGLNYIYQDGDIIRNEKADFFADEDYATLLEFCYYSYKVMTVMGEPTLTAEEELAMTALYGATLPGDLSESERRSVAYMMIKGIISPNDITPASLTSLLNPDKSLVYLSRIYDKDSRLNYSLTVSELDLTMANKGFYRSEIKTELAPLPKDIKTSIPVQAIDYYDYLIPKTGYDAFDNRMFFSNKHGSTTAGPGQIISSSTFIEGIEYVHFRLPKNLSNYPGILEKGMLEINTPDDTDVPRAIKVPEGGGIYNVKYESEDNVITLTPQSNDRQFSTKRNKESKISEEFKIYNYAGSSPTARVEFITSDPKNIIFNNIPLESIMSNSNPAQSWITHTNGYKFRIRLLQPNTWKVEIELPPEDAKFAYKLIRLKNTSNTTSYPSYVSAQNETALVSSLFLREQLGIELQKRDENKFVLHSNKKNIETTIDLERGLVVSGSVVLKFGDAPILIENNDEYFIDYRAVSNQLAESYIFVGSGNMVTVNPTLKTTSDLGVNPQQKTSISLWTDSNVKSLGVTQDGKLNLNYMNNVVTTFLILRDINDMSALPKLVSTAPSISGSSPSQAMNEFFGSDAVSLNSISLKDVPLTSPRLTFDPKTGVIWYNAPLRAQYTPSKYYSGAVPLPIYKNTDSSFIVANIPLAISQGKSQPDVVDKNGYIKRSYLDPIPNFETTPYVNPVSGAKTQLNKPIDSYISFPTGFPTTLHQSEVRELEDIKGLVLTGGGLFVPNKTTVDSNSSTIDLVPFTPGASIAEEEKKIVESRRSFITQSLEVNTGDKPGVIKLPKNTKLISIQWNYDVDETGIPRSVYVPVKELSTISVHNIEGSMLDKFLFKLSTLAESLLESLDKSERLKLTAIRSFNDALNVLYLLILIILPKLFMLSILVISALSLVTNNRIFVWLSENFIDIIWIFSFGLIRYDELNPRMVWISGIVSSSLLVMTSMGVLENVLIHFLEQIITITERLLYM